MVLSGIAFVGSVLLMSPKGGIWLWIGGISWGNEYWSKKSLEGKVKKIATVTSIIFIIASLLLPYSK